MGGAILQHSCGLSVRQCKSWADEGTDGISGTEASPFVVAEGRRGDGGVSMAIAVKPGGICMGRGWGGSRPRSR